MNQLQHLIKSSFSSLFVSSFLCKWRETEGEKSGRTKSPSMATPQSKIVENKATSMEKSKWTEDEEEDEFEECVEDQNGSVSPVLEDGLDSNELEKRKVALMRAFVEREDPSAKVTTLSSLVFNASYGNSISFHHYFCCDRLSSFNQSRLVCSNPSYRLLFFNLWLLLERSRGFFLSCVQCSNSIVYILFCSSGVPYNHIHGINTFF